MILTADGSGPYTHSFEDFTPGRRFDDVPWTAVYVEESTDKTGPWTQYAHGTLSPVDTDPEAPASREFTAPGAALAAGWNRVVFTDADGNLQPSRPLYVGATWKPGSKDVARLLRARLYVQGGRIPDFLDEDDDGGPTDPTRDEVLELIDDATSDVMSRVGTVLAPGVSTIAQHVTALGTAMLIELGSEDYDSDRYDRLQVLYDQRLAQLLDAAQDEATGGETGNSDDRLTAAGSFGSAAGTFGGGFDHVPGSEHSWDVIGKNGIGDFEC